jgi:hypothetical protein
VRGALPLLRPIIDTHHRLWDRGGWTYLLPELLADLNTGHNVVATVFEECRGSSWYRLLGAGEFRIGKYRRRNVMRWRIVVKSSAARAV